VLILGVVQNGLELAGISSVWQTMLTGAILIVTAVVNQRVAGRRG
jgi:ribose/xylose/arabinose/galactoside ABC-type transport system permease subunit